MHTFLTIGMGSKLRQLDKNQLQTVDDMIRMLHMHHCIMMVITIQSRFENLVHQVERINRLQQFVAFACI